MPENGGDPRRRSSVVFDGPDRAHARAYMKGIGFGDEDLRKPIIGVANTWIEAMPCNFHLRVSRREGEGGGAQGRRHPDGVQHHRGLGRGDDGYPGHEGVAGQPRGDRRLDRADGARLPVRCACGHLRLRQDDPRQRHGACPARHPVGAALRRLDPAGPLPGARRHDPGRVRGDRRPRQGRHDRRGARRARGRGEPRPGRVRRHVHRQHDGRRLRGHGNRANGLRDGPGGCGGAEDGRRAGRRAGHDRAARGPAAKPGDHARVDRERDRFGGDVGRLHQRRPAPAGARPGVRDRPHDRRLRPHLRAHSAAGRPEARRPLRRPGPERGRGSGAAGEAPGRGGAAEARRDHGHGPHDRRGGRRRGRDARARRSCARSATRSRRPAAW